MLQLVLKQQNLARLTFNRKVMKRRLQQQQQKQQQQQQKQQQQQQQCGLVWRYSNLNLDLLQLQLFDDVYKNKSLQSRQEKYNIFSNLAIFTLFFATSLVDLYF